MRFWLSRLILLAMLLPASAWAQSRIDQLGSGAAVQSTDTFPNCQGCGAVTSAVKNTWAQALTFIQNNIANTVSAGTGLTGGGAVSGNPTISLSTPVSATNGGTGVNNGSNTLTLGTSTTLPSAPASTQCLHMTNAGAITAAGADCSGSQTGFGIDGGTASVTITASCTLGTTAACISHNIRLVKIGTLSGAITVTLDAIANVSTDTAVCIDDAGQNIGATNTLTIAPNASDSINGGTVGASIGAFTNPGIGICLRVSATHNWVVESGATIPASTAPANQFANSVGINGLGYAQPAFTNISGRATSAQVPTDVAYLDVVGQVYTGGIYPTAFSNGTATSGTTTVDCGNGPIQSLTDGGAFTLAMAAHDGTCVLRVTNNGSAGAITFSGFSEGSNKGDALDTTNGHIFDITLTRIGGNPHYLVSALQ